MVARALPAGLPARSRDFHVVVSASSRRRSAGRLATLAVMVFALFLMLILSRTALDQSAFVIEDLNRQIAAEESRYWELRLQVSQLRDPARIAALAAEMGMVYPDEVRPVAVPGLGEPGPRIEERWASLKILLSAQP